VSRGRAESAAARRKARQTPDYLRRARASARRATIRLVAGSSCPRHRLSAGDDDGPTQGPPAPAPDLHLPLLARRRQDAV